MGFFHQLYLRCPTHDYYKPLKTIFCYFNLNETTFQILVCLLDSLLLCSGENSGLQVSISVLLCFEVLRVLTKVNGDVRGVGLQGLCDLSSLRSPSRLIPHWMLISPTLQAGDQLRDLKCLSLVQNGWAFLSVFMKFIICRVFLNFFYSLTVLCKCVMIFSHFHLSYPLSSLLLTLNLILPQPISVPPLSSPGMRHRV